MILSYIIYVIEIIGLTKFTKITKLDCSESLDFKSRNQHEIFKKFRQSNLLISRIATIFSRSKIPNRVENVFLPIAQAATEVLNNSHFSLQMGNCPIPVAEHSGLRAAQNRFFCTEAISLKFRYYNLANLEKGLQRKKGCNPQSEFHFKCGKPQD